MLPQFVAVVTAVTPPPAPPPQDTVVALQALAQFAELVHGDSLDLDVVVKTDDQRERFYINGTNALLQQTQQITVPNRVLFKVTGAGCALVQVRETRSRPGGFREHSLPIAFVVQRNPFPTA